MSAESSAYPACRIHDEALAWEPGGVDQPTISGRWRCDLCDTDLTAALDAKGDSGTSS